MLRPPYSRYDQIHMYHLDLPSLPAFNDPDLIGAWIEDGTAVMFFHQNKDRFIERLCRLKQCSIIYQAQLGYDEWETGQEITRFRVGNLSVAPIWEKASADIILDPSIIFGSGFHPSTRLCLEALQHYVELPSYQAETVADLGTGTGLLAIAAAKLGAEKITAVDNNPLACEIARKNVALNNVEDRISVKQLDLRNQYPEQRYDLVIANLYKGLLQELFTNPIFWQAKLFLITGFIPAMEPDLLAALPRSGLKFLERRRADRWCLWVLEQRGNRKE